MDILTSIRKREKMYSTMLKSKNNNNSTFISKKKKHKFNKYKNFLNIITKKYNNIYFCIKINEAKRDIRKSWGIINVACNNNKN